MDTAQIAKDAAESAFPNSCYFSVTESRNVFAVELPKFFNAALLELLDRAASEGYPSVKCITLAHTSTERTTAIAV